MVKKSREVIRDYYIQPEPGAEFVQVNEAEYQKHLQDKSPKARLDKLLKGEEKKPGGQALSG